MSLQWYAMFDDLDKVVDSKFWSIINDLRVHATKKQRIKSLEQLKYKLETHEYFPSLPIAVKESDKGHGVARQVPIFKLDDYSVYYYCVRKLEHVLAKNRVVGTYGGWSMGGRIRKMEVEDDPGDEYQMTFSYNPAAWAKYYGEYNAKIYEKIQELRASGKGDHLVFELDIANYYDNIQLGILENKIRLDSDYKESGVLDLLMYFLGYSNRHVTQYQKRSVGIPQDAFGDCSRLLANYYLQDYDLYMHELAKQHNADYLRYADDQILFVPNAEAGEILIQLASRRLAKLGLNINQKKVVQRTLDDLYSYRSFDINNIFSPYGARNDKGAVNDFATKTFEALNENPQALKDKGYPLIKRLVTADFNLLTPDFRAKLVQHIFDKTFIKLGRAYNFSAAYEKLRDNEKSDYLKIMDQLVIDTKHSSLHYEILAFYRQQGLNAKSVEDRLADLQKDIYRKV